MVIINVKGTYIEERKNIIKNGKEILSLAESATQNHKQAARDMDKCRTDMLNRTRRLLKIFKSKQNVDALKMIEGRLEGLKDQLFGRLLGPSGLMNADSGRDPKEVKPRIEHIVVGIKATISGVFSQIKEVDKWVSKGIV